MKLKPLLRITAPVMGISLLPLAIGLRDVRTQLDRFLLSGDRRQLEAVPAIRRQVDHWLAEAERTAVTPREQDLIARATEGYRHFFAEFERITRAASVYPPQQS